MNYKNITQIFILIVIIIASSCQFNCLSISKFNNQTYSILGKWSFNRKATKHRVFSWDATPFVKGPGTYESVIKQTDGKSPLSINWIALYKNDRLISKDNHKGYTGKQSINIDYTLSIITWDKNSTYTVKASLLPIKSADPEGYILFNRKNVNTHVPQTLKKGLKVEYFRDKHLIKYTAKGVMRTVNAYWGTGRPHYRLPYDKFSVRWSGWIEPKYSEEYTFMLSSDNCSRLWINDQMVTDTWTNYVKRKNRVKIKMQKGKKYKIRVEYFNIYGTSFVKLFWKSRSQRLEIVPEKSLYYNPHEKPFAKRSKGLTLYIGVKQNIPHHELLRVIRKVRESSQYLSLITKKELYVDNAIFTFYSAKGHLVWDKYRKKMPMGLDNIPMAPEYWWTQLIVHEFVHSIFKLLDDDIGYGYKWGQAPYRCLMAHNWNAPFCPVCHKRLGLKILYKGVPFHKRPENPVTRITFNYK